MKSTCPLEIDQVAGKGQSSSSPQERAELAPREPWWGVRKGLNVA